MGLLPSTNRVRDLVKSMREMEEARKARASAETQSALSTYLNMKKMKQDKELEEKRLAQQQELADKEDKRKRDEAAAKQKQEELEAAEKEKERKRKEEYEKYKEVQYMEQQWRDRKQTYIANYVEARDAQIRAGKISHEAVIAEAEAKFVKIYGESPLATFNKNKIAEQEKANKENAVRPNAPPVAAPKTGEPAKADSVSKYGSSNFYKASPDYDSSKESHKGSSKDGYGYTEIMKQGVSNPRGEWLKQIVQNIFVYNPNAKNRSTMSWAAHNLLADISKDPSKAKELYDMINAYAKEAGISDDVKNAVLSKIKEVGKIDTSTSQKPDDKTVTNKPAGEKPTEEKPTGDGTSAPDKEIEEKKRNEERKQTARRNAIAKIDEEAQGFISRMAPYSSKEYAATVAEEYSTLLTEKWDVLNDEELTDEERNAKLKDINARYADFVTKYAAFAKSAEMQKAIGESSEKMMASFASKAGCKTLEEAKKLINDGLDEQITYNKVQGGKNITVTSTMRERIFEHLMFVVGIPAANITEDMIQNAYMKVKMDALDMEKQASSATGEQKGGKTEVQPVKAFGEYVESLVDNYKTEESDERAGIKLTYAERICRAFINSGDVIARNAAVGIKDGTYDIYAVRDVVWSYMKTILYSVESISEQQGGQEMIQKALTTARKVFDKVLAITGLDEAVKKYAEAKKRLIEEAMKSDNYSGIFEDTGIEAQKKENG